MDPVPVTAGAPESITLAGYVFQYPAWWHDEEVPALPVSTSSNDAAEDFIVEHFASVSAGRMDLDDHALVAALED